MVVLITGGSGSLGIELQKIFLENISPTHKELDITNKEQIKKIFQENKIDTIIHTAAITKVRKCEEDKQLAWDVNVQGTKNLIDEIIQLKSNINFSAIVNRSESGVASALLFPVGILICSRLREKVLSTDSSVSTIVVSTMISSSDSGFSILYSYSSCSVVNSSIITFMSLAFFPYFELDFSFFDKSK